MNALDRHMMVGGAHNRFRFKIDVVEVANRLEIGSPTMDELIGEVSEETGVSREDILADAKGRRGAHTGRGGRARNAIVWLAYRVTRHASGAIGRPLGLTDNAVRRAIADADLMRKREPAFEELTNRLHVQYMGARP
ncbi:MAG: hypothetical protein EOP62_14245 [Sphingomonadales bacterium]|nr:MAG: hypothetical protein EOP62_14245 [Sphingomonadales bacterium]